MKVRSFLIILVALIHLESFADVRHDLYHVEIGEKIAVDVAGHGPVAISFEIDTTQTSPLLPILKVEKEYGGFKCTVTLLETSKVEVDESSRFRYEAVINWSPGSDLSGCYVTIQDPYLKKTAEVHLYMCY